MSASGEKGWSMTWMIAALMLAIIGIGWAVAANDYTVKTEGAAPNGELPSTNYRVARSAMFRNAFAQIPNLPQVVSHAFSDARWIVYVFGGLEIAALLFGVVVWRVERESAEGMGGRRRKR